MATLPSQVLNTFYEKYSAKDLAFNKSVRELSGLETKKIFIKLRNEQWPCVLYSCSMSGAKVIIEMTPANFEEIKKNKNLVNLRLSFFPQTAKAPLTFFIPSTVKGYNIFQSSNSKTFLMSLEFTQKPPDDLIEVLGKIFEMMENFEKRKDLRINLEPKVIEDIGLVSNKSIAIIDSVKRVCIVKNISAGGCGIVMMCNPKFLMEKPVTIVLNFVQNNEPIQIGGKIIRSEEIEGKKGFYLLGIVFEQDKIPMEYKVIINNYLDALQKRKKNLKNE